MKKLLLLVLFGLSLSFSVSAQDYPKLSDNEDTLFLTPSCKFIAGSDIKAGTGSTDDGSFKYIRISTSSWTHYSSTNSPNGREANQANSLPAKMSGLKMHIKKIKFVGNKKRGYTTYLILGAGSLTNYECDITQAIKCGEIECDGCETKSKNSTTIINNTPSMADELLKIKKLKDDGILTEEEYKIQKTKILNK